MQGAEDMWWVRFPSPAPLISLGFFIECRKTALSGAGSQLLFCVLFSIGLLGVHVTHPAAAQPPAPLAAADAIGAAGDGPPIPPWTIAFGKSHDREPGWTSLTDLAVPPDEDELILVHARRVRFHLFSS